MALEFEEFTYQISNVSEIESEMKIELPSLSSFGLMAAKTRNPIDTLNLSMKQYITLIKETFS